jgi:phosphoserine phosphatase RsbU/P
MKKKILIVEDDPMVQELHKYYVNNLGHEVVGVFTKGSELLDFLKDNSADLVLMDIGLEDDLDGIETMLKQQSSNNIPVVYISGNIEDSDLKRAINTNMQGFLSKPVSPDDLDKIITKLQNLNESIVYAAGIQEAIFPQMSDIKKYFKNSTYINRPKDIVTGDFPFLHHSKNNQFIIGGIGDCTGHGIPGALLSVLCHEILSESSRFHTDLRKVIFELNERLIKNFTDYRNTLKIADSAEIILFKIIPEDSKIEICAVNRPYIHYDSKNKVLNYVKMKTKSLGTTIENYDDIPFDELVYNENDYFYFFSDGVVDQFGGEKNKKLTPKRFIQFLNELSSGPINSRQIELDVFLRKWQGNLEQTDDMILMGICPQYTTI